MARTREMLVPLNMYLSAGIHIGMNQRLKAMQSYIYKVRPDKLSVFDLQKIDARLAAAAKFLSKYEPKDILAVSRKRNGHLPVVKFADAIGGATAVYGRFMPGMLTNPNAQNYFEPKIVIVTDSFADKQAVQEAYNANLPIIGICDTFNDPKFIDLVIPGNNKGKKSVALLYWILAREYLKARGEIKGDAEFKFAAEDFEMTAKPTAGYAPGKQGRKDSRTAR